MAQGSITFLGTGTAFHTGGRGSQSLFVRPPEGSPLLVDVAPTAIAAALRHGVDLASVDRLFLTHLHGDHVAGWPFLFLHFLFVHARSRPFDVYGPVGSRRTLEGLLELCYAELVDRARFPVRYHELPVIEAEAVPVGDAARIDTLPMLHHASSIGLRLRLARAGGECVVAVSGDTAWCPAVPRLADGADVLVLECTSVGRGIEGHLSLEEIRSHAAELGARRVVLVHLTDDVASDLATDPLPRTLAAHDGLEIAFPE